MCQESSGEVIPFEDKTNLNGEKPTNARWQNLKDSLGRRKSY